MMYSNNGTCHSGRNPYMSLKASDYGLKTSEYGLKEPEMHSLRISSPADDSTSPPQTSAASSRASPSIQKIQAVASTEAGGPLSSHPVTPVESPDRPILEVPVASDKAQPHTRSARRASTSPLDPNNVPDLSLHMPGSQRHHSHSSSAPDDHHSHHKNDTFATRFLRLRSLSTTLRGKNDSKLSLSLSSVGLHRPRSSHSTTASSMPAAPLARSSTTPLAGTKRPASRGSTLLDEQGGENPEGAARQTIGRRARKTSAALLASARRASGFWGADDGSSTTTEHKKRQKQQQQQDSGAAYRLPELQGVNVELQADRMFAGTS